MRIIGRALLATPTHNQNNGGHGRECSDCGAGIFSRRMEGSVGCNEGGGGCGKDTVGGLDLAFSLGDGERSDVISQRRCASSTTSETVPTDLFGVGGTPNGAGPPQLLSEALKDSHWGEDDGLLMNRGTPSNDWATFSPVSSSSNCPTAEETSRNWMQTIAESSVENPAITSQNDAAVDVSPGWQAFSLGDELSATSLPWSEISAASTDTGNTPGSVNRTQSNEPYQTEPHDSCSIGGADSSSVVVFRHCFIGGEGATDDRGDEGRGGGEGEKGREGPLVVATESSGWQCVRDDSFAKLLWRWSQTSLHHPPPSSCHCRLTSLLGGDPSTNESEGAVGVGSVALPLGDEEKFDWTPPERRRRSMSPDIVPNLFRPRKESLVDVDFDHDRAASGLSVLSEVELQRMCDEMTSKFSRLSAELLASLQARDVLAGEMEAKNRFVSALLRVQQLRLSQDINGSSGEAGRGRQWAWSQKKRDEEASPYLQTVIPYKTPEGLRWRTATLTLLTKVLKAMAEGSSTVPKLMAEYLQSEFLTSPVTDRRHSFKDSLSSDQSTVLSNLTI